VDSGDMRTSSSFWNKLMGITSCGQLSGRLGRGLQLSEIIRILEQTKAETTEFYRRKEVKTMLPMPYRIMIIDDTPANLKLLDENCCVSNGYNVCAFPRGDMALRAWPRICRI
jgi:PleD family two-component response regulator